MSFRANTTTCPSPTPWTPNFSSLLCFTDIYTYHTAVYYKSNLHIISENHPCFFCRKMKEVIRDWGLRAQNLEKHCLSVQHHFPLYCKRMVFCSWLHFTIRLHLQRLMLDQNAVDGDKNDGENKSLSSVCKGSFWPCFPIPLLQKSRQAHVWFILSNYFKYYSCFPINMELGFVNWCCCSWVPVQSVKYICNMYSFFLLLYR